MVTMEKKVIQLSESVWQIQDTNNGIMSVNCFLIAGKEKALLADSGFGEGSLKEVVEGLTNLPLILVNTHADGDHVLGNKQFGLAHMHPAEFDRYHRAVGYDAPVEALWEGDVLDIGGRRFEVILIPGHTPGSIALLDRENRLLLGGDSVQGGTIFMIGQGRNMSGYMASMRKLKGIQDQFDTVYTGHGRVLEGSGILDELIDGAVKVYRGEVEGKAMERKIENLEGKTYTVGRVTFLYT
ncbi:MAG: MBL fold metallo-hydrolase [Clostridiales bacterium]|nr:MBL fold metallo-hydrolase [Clostridiales bacterium]